MATSIGEPVGGTSPPGLPAGKDRESARAILAMRRDPWSRVIRLVVILVALGILARGWVVTDIDPGKLTNASNALPILKALLQPDVASRDVTSLELSLPFIVGAGSNGPATANNPAGQRLQITPGSASAGQLVAFDGFGFAPDSDGQLRLQNPSRGLDALFLRVHTDAQGAFHDARPWLDAATAPPDVYTFKLIINAPTGNLHLSETLISSLGRMGETILLALMGTVFGVVFSIPLSFLGARNLMNGSLVGRGVYWIVRLIFTITRSVEVLILGVIMVVIVGIGSYAGVLAIVVHSVGSLGKLYSEAIESIEPGPVEAITATGADRVQTVLFGVIPQVVPTFLAVTIFWWDHNVRMSTVLGLVGGGGIGYLLIQYINLLQFNQAATVLWMIIVVVAVMDYASAAIRSRLV
jgi:phosphonate transport system permease protein